MSPAPDRDAPPTGSLDALFAPRSVAIVGASDDPRRIGGRPVRYLREQGFAGPILPVNPRRETVQGLPAWPSVRDVPGEIDVAIVAVPAEAVVETVEACAERGVKAAVVFTAGFAEMDAEGAARQARVAAVARDAGMRVLGPNCLGVYNAGLGYLATFTSTLDVRPPQPGPVAIVSQSGAYGSHLGLLARLRRMGVGLWVTTGNECDVSVAECIAWMASAPEVKVIAAYAEGVRDGDALLDAFEAARAAGKAIVFGKVGRSEIGAQAARSHTASLAGSDAVFDAVLRQHGVYRAPDSESMLDAAYLAGFGVLPRGRRLGIETVSGGAGVMMADEAADVGLELPAMPADAQAELKAMLPFAAVRNPVDVTAQMFNRPELVSAFLDRMLEAGGYDAVVAFFTYVGALDYMIGPMREAFAEARRRFPERLTVLSIVAPDDVCERYEASGVPVFEDPIRAVRAIAACADIGAGLALVPRAARRPHADAAGDAPPPGPMDEAAAARLLASWGVPAIESRHARDAAQAARAAGELGFPVALKVLSADLAHKSDVGGVALGLADAGAVAAAYAAMMTRVADAAPHARIDGALVSPMVAGGVETILGTSRDPVFGPVVMVGLGGVFAETLGDVCLRLAPVDAAEARRMVESLAGWPLLAGTRGRPPADVDALVDAIVRLSLLAASHADAIESIDVNPFVVLERGRGALALDALVVTRR